MSADENKDIRRKKDRESEWGKRMVYLWKEGNTRTYFFIHMKVSEINGASPQSHTMTVGR